MIVLANILSFTCLILNASLFLRLKAPYSFYTVALPMAAGALSPILLLLSLLGAGLGGLAASPAALIAGLLSAGISAFAILSVVFPQADIETAFGADWQTKLSQEQAARLLKRRWGLGLPKTPAPIFEQNIPFWTIPGTERKLLCDLWQPPAGAARSGLAVIYLHGSGWYYFDKDTGTRPFFHQLTAQGHVVMDVAYRLCPEVDIYGMVADVKRSVAWMKANAHLYNVNPERIILAGGSAGGHLALLAAYTPDDARLNPADLAGQDLSVRGVISTYGPVDMRATYRHLAQERLIGLPRVEIGQPGADTMQKNFSDAGRVDTLLGGHLQEVPEAYELASPLAHAGSACPPTLLIQGESDVIAPIAATRELHRKLAECGVPAVNIVYPLANHAFDLLLPNISPAARSALYDIERFLALLV
jgi:acetyl esterase/lipase